eukprot:CAMPEP_0179176574 /NCGR_PEP_ID=MMETSP0796-20121207/87312_1 /TAXON_ID=73915 /ORGANISM="Pyrodinium bahamense, Strain pbaha01" /LENGTH=57 /DNA_ID=CAMNT_0020880113 /DNA_START=36 /DNA_END=209 /DNA_ORIENTATION=-
MAPDSLTNGVSIVAEALRILNPRVHLSSPPHSGVVALNAISTTATPHAAPHAEICAT